MSAYNSRVKTAVRAAAALDDFRPIADPHGIAARVHLRWDVDEARNGERQFRFHFNNVADLPYSWRLTFTRMFDNETRRERFEISLLAADEGDERVVLKDRKTIDDEFDIAATYSEEVGEHLVYEDWCNGYMALDAIPHVEYLLDVIEVCKQKLTALLAI